jgi:hypothetical protein
MSAMQRKKRKSKRPPGAPFPLASGRLNWALLRILVPDTYLVACLPPLQSPSTFEQYVSPYAAREFQWYHIIAAGAANHFCQVFGTRADYMKYARDTEAHRDCN